MSQQAFDAVANASRVRSWRNHDLPGLLARYDIGIRNVSRIPPGYPCCQILTIQSRPNMFVAPFREIVICAGGVRYLPCAWVWINMLRKQG
jgi:hypothetical protein